MLLLTISFSTLLVFRAPYSFRIYNLNSVNALQKPQKHVKTPLETLHFFGFYNPNRVRRKSVVGKGRAVILFRGK